MLSYSWRHIASLTLSFGNMKGIVPIVLTIVHGGSSGYGLFMLGLFRCCAVRIWEQEKNSANKIILTKKNILQNEWRHSNYDLIMGVVGEAANSI